ncbi:unnamed protein product [marine sediment metagenome]|uniref:Uncharacterized protein n=1 Tax=marine sediment metagenome TaxID=412755 RepID=X1PW55_9ZZZZ
MANIDVRSIIGVVVLLIVGTAVLPIIIDSVAAASASLTGAAKTMIGINTPPTPQRAFGHE